MDIAHDMDAMADMEGVFLCWQPGKGASLRPVLVQKGGCDELGSGTSATSLPGRAEGRRRVGLIYGEGY